MGWVAGWHHWAASILTVGSLLHLALLVQTDRYRKPNHWHWYAAVWLAFFCVAFMVTGNLLPGDRHGVQTTVMEAAIAGRVPLVGPDVRAAFLWGEQFGTHTVVWWAALHRYVLPLALAGLFVVVAWFRTPPIEGRVAWRAVGALVLATLVLGFVLGAPLGSSATLADHQSFNTTVSWYAWPMHGALRAFETMAPGWGWIGATFLPALALVFLLALPWISERATGTLIRQVFWLGLLLFVGIGFGFAGSPVPPWVRPDPVQISTATSQPQSAIDQALTTRGRDVYQQNGCGNCHGIDGAKATVGPDLDGVHKVHPEPDWYIGFIRDPSKTNPGTVMPAFPSLTQEELRSLAEYLRKPR